jgi:hypothetical protein
MQCKNKPPIVTVLPKYFKEPLMDGVSFLKMHFFVHGLQRLEGCQLSILLTSNPETICGYLRMLTMHEFTSQKSALFKAYAGQCSFKALRESGWSI